jgi:glycerophosphoryl diester phosphodiesterase
MSPTVSTVDAVHPVEGAMSAAESLLETRTAGAGTTPTTVPTPPTGTDTGRTVPGAGTTRTRMLPAHTGRFPHVVAHRGASGYRPEHTLAGYELAAMLCADFLEPDLVSTRDGVLVARHGPEISRSTDVADRPGFADRHSTRRIEDRLVSGWFVDDFTIEEIKTLRARERLPLLRPENTVFDDRFEVPTLAEILELRSRLSERIGWEIGLYPEVKHPTYHAEVGLDPAQLLLAALDGAGLNRPDAPVFVPAHDPTVLRAQRARGPRSPAVQLLTSPSGPYEERTRYGITPGPLARADLDLVAEYAQAIGTDKTQVIGWTADGRLDRPTSLVTDAHAAGLQVHARTFRAERSYLPVGLRHGELTGVDFGGATDEIAAHLVAGVDAVLVDHPDIAVLARQEARGRTRPAA